jgi:hypothetical protein
MDAIESKLQLVLTLKIIISSIIVGMLVNDAHYDIPVLIASTSTQAMDRAVGHALAVADGSSIIFEYAVPVLLLSLFTLQGLALYIVRNRLVSAQMVMFVLGMVIFNLVVTPTFDKLVRGTLSTEAIPDSLVQIALGHVGVAIMLIVSIYIDWMLSATAPKV